MTGPISHFTPPTNYYPADPEEPEKKSVRHTLKSAAKQLRLYEMLQTLQALPFGQASEQAISQLRYAFCISSKCNFIGALETMVLISRFSFRKKEIGLIKESIDKYGILHSKLKNLLVRVSHETNARSRNKITVKDLHWMILEIQLKAIEKRHETPLSRVGYPTMPNKYRFEMHHLKTHPNYDSKKVDNLYKDFYSYKRYFRCMEVVLLHKNLKDKIFEIDLLLLSMGTLDLAQLKGLFQRIQKDEIKLIGTRILHYLHQKYPAPSDISPHDKKILKILKPHFELELSSSNRCEPYFLLSMCE